ncbi:MAG: extracellular solute-binding protein [Oligoflexus sp.]
MKQNSQRYRSNSRHMAVILMINGFFSLFFASVLQAKQDIVVYSARNEHLIKPLFDAYEKKHDVNIRYVTDQAPALLERLKAEGKRSPADILYTVDAGNLWQATEAELLQPIDSKTLQEKIPEHLRDEKNRWFGLSIRARTIVYHPGKVKIEDLKNYQDLADKKWKGRLCLRTSQKVYNQSLVAMMIDEYGVEKTEKTVKSWVDNLATKVFSNDTAVIQAVESGQCDVGLVNSYYYAQLLAENPKLQAKLFWPSKGNGGTHVNISGAGVTKYAKNKEAAVALLEWLVSAEAQKILAETNYEFPVVEGTPLAGIVKSWGKIDHAAGHLTKAGELQAEAVKLMDRAGYR